MIAVDDPEVYKWLSRANQYGGSFVKLFAKCVFAADEANYALLKPVVLILMEKYPNYNRE
jgi:hypothetical protein